MKTIHIFLFCLLVSLPAIAQDSEASSKAALKAAAARMNQALINRQYEALIKTTYPRALEMTKGGEQTLIATIKGQMEGYDQQGCTIVAAWVEEPTPFIDTAGELQCTVPQKMKLKFETGILTTETTLLALSPDKGTTWYFMDAADRDITRMRTMFPNLSSRLVLSPSPLPTFKSNTKKAPAKTPAKAPSKK